MSLITLTDISKTYTRKGTAANTALRSINYQFESGKSYSIMGPSGSGKSTLLSILAGISEPTTGIYTFQNQKMNGLSDAKKCDIRNRHIGWVVQDFALLEGETALRNCLYPALLAGKNKIQATDRAETLLKKLEMERYANQNVSLLSGGERQRIAIARAMMNNPSLLLADEPTGALDSHTTKIVMETLLSLCADNVTLILATHNPECAALCNIHLTIRDGELLQ